MTLSIQNLCFERCGQDLFHHMNYDIHRGECLQITGINGSGKTTLLRILAGFIEPTQGDILWNQHSIFKIRGEYQPHIQYIGHKNGVKPYLTVLENIRLYCTLKGEPLSETYIQHAVERVGLSKKS